MKILELTNFSKGICGVWARVREEALRLVALGHEVKVFSSDFVKGSDEIAGREDKIGKVEIKRFPAKKLGGEGYLSWKFEKEALKYRPDVIIAHSYRLFHTTRALKIAKKIGARVFLVTHAPFIKGDVTRSFFAKAAVKFYDYFIGPKTINKFEKVIAITKWEIPYLKKLGVRENKVFYAPNGIPEEFFRQKKEREDKNKILFLGRISPIKNIETLIDAVKLLGQKIKLEVVGPAEEKYKERLVNKIKEYGLEKRIIFSGPIYGIKEKIKKIDSARIFVLPSKSEAMPQALIEAMARGKIVIASANQGASDLIKDGKNGYLFDIGDSKGLAEKINATFNKKRQNLGKEAKKRVMEFSWNKIIKKIEKMCLDKNV